MGFLKSCLAVVSFFMLHACTSKVAQPPVQEEVAVTSTAVVSQTADKTLPQFAMLDAAGNAQNLQNFKGKKVLVNLWATWCPPCRAELPSLEKLYNSIDKEKTAFVFVSLDKDFEIAKKYAQSHKLNVPIYYPAGDLPDLFAVDGIPTTFIFDEQGRLLAQREGSEDYNTPRYRKLFGGASK